MKRHAMRTICAAIVVLTVVGCASTQQVQPKGHLISVKIDERSGANCTSTMGAREYFGLPLRVQHDTLADCSNGALLACIAAPTVFPLAAGTVIIGAPVLLPLLMWAPNPCPEPGTMQTEMSNSGMQQERTEPHQEEQPSSAEPQ